MRPPSTRLVAALGGNALLRRGEPLTAANQRRNVAVAASALAPIAASHSLVVTHGNGPQVGLLALQGAAYRATDAYPLDVLDAETEGQIGYLIEQELMNRLPAGRRCATVLTQIEVDRNDPAFAAPTKPIGPVYSQADSRRLQDDRGWTFCRDGVGYRRVVASPEPRRIFEIGVIELLVENGVIVICAGGGGIPVVRRDDGGLVGVEAVIDKDKASALLATQVRAGALLLLTDVDGVYLDCDTPKARRIKRISPDAIRRHRFAEGSMGPKVEAACRFVEATGGTAGIGALKDAAAILAGAAGTAITARATATEFWD
ncbi:carbamate kinase [Microbaculum marinisediminis]|uniref:Carbamate kinase n=1 Tax=Microbaculum marinisediminis TaxID=2931392 RepID=A0AAW5R3Q8_9HYPH|nr:carbamate kinase [Microbaculum sp. A6E488]MCT8974568.1 carbamate kinase [Microbaculum sp. A6E488]